MSALSSTASAEALPFTFAPIPKERRKPSAAAVKIAELHNSKLPPKPKPAADPSPLEAVSGTETLESILGEPPAPEPAKVDAPLRHDSATAVDFLRWLDPDGRHNLCVIHPTKTNPKGDPLCEGRTFAPHSWAEMATYIEQHQDWNVYFSVNEPKPDAPHKKLTKFDIGAIRAIPADFDPNKKLEEAGSFAGERVRIAALSDDLLAGADAPASVAIDSGGGHQLLWSLQQKVPAAEFGERCEAQARGIARQFGGDGAVTPICQVMRLPGTINLPNEGKRARGRVPTRATLLASNDNRHTLEALGEWTAPVAAPAGSGSGGAKDDILDIDGPWFMTALITSICPKICAANSRRLATATRGSSLFGKPGKAALVGKMSPGLAVRTRSSVYFAPTGLSPWNTRSFTRRGSFTRKSAPNGTSRGRGTETGRRSGAKGSRTCRRSSIRLQQPRRRKAKRTFEPMCSSTFI